MAKMVTKSIGPGKVKAGRRLVMSGRLRDDSRLIAYEGTKLVDGISFLQGVQKFPSGHKLPKSLFVFQDARSDWGASETAHVIEQNCSNLRAVPGRFDELRSERGRKYTVVMLPQLYLAPKRSRLGRSREGRPGDVGPKDAEESIILLFNAFPVASRVERAILPLGDLQFVRLIDPTQPKGKPVLHLIVLDHSPELLPPYGMRGFEAFTRRVLGKVECQSDFFKRILRDTDKKASSNNSCGNSHANGGKNEQ